MRHNFENARTIKVGNLEAMGRTERDLRVISGGNNQVDGDYHAQLVAVGNGYDGV